MMIIDPRNEKTSNLHKYILGSVVPRPIAFASTIDENGVPNLSPFSFFNAFSANPPILIFSPARRVRDNTIKHTLENVIKNKEVVISIVNSSMSQQMSLSSAEFEKGINEFEKAGFTPKKSKIVSPFLIQESPVNFECKVNDIIHLGDQGGAGNLIICEILQIHIKEDVLDEDKNIDPIKLDAISRLGGSFYSKINEENIFQIPKPIHKIGMGVDQLPREIRDSDILTGNELAILASYEKTPSKNKSESERRFNNIKEQHQIAKELILAGKSDEAWQILL